MRSYRPCSFAQYAKLGLRRSCAASRRGLSGGAAEAGVAPGRVFVDGDDGVRVCLAANLDVARDGAGNESKREAWEKSVHLLGTECFGVFTTNLFDNFAFSA